MGVVGRFLALFLLFLVFSAAPAPAQDVLGLYFDTQGTQTSAQTATPYEAVTAYLVLKDPGFADGIASWECIVSARTVGADPIMTWQLSGQALNVAQPPAFLVGLGAPLPSIGDVVLATAQVLVPDPAQQVAFFIHPFDPPSLIDPPGWGYPVYTPVYVHSTSEEMVPLEWSSGCEARPVAVINGVGEAPGWDLTGLPDTLDLGYVEVGETDVRSLHATLAGEVPVSGTVHLSGAGYQYRTGDGYFTDQPTSFRLEPGEELDMEVRLVPTDSLVYQGQLVLAACDRSFTVDLVGGYVEGACLIGFAGPVHDFGVVPVGGEATHGFLVGNGGGGILVLDPVVEHPDFTVARYAGGGFPYTLYPGGQAYVYVTFGPTADGVVETVIDLGPSACPELQLTGEGSSTIPPECDQNVTALDFGEVAVDAQLDRWVLISNTGGNILPVDLTLEQEGAAFTMNQDPGLYELGPGQELQVRVTFQPPELGGFQAVLHTGTVCSDVTLDGTGREPLVSYQVPQELALPSTLGGATSQRAITIYNNGETVVSGDLSIGGDPEFTLINPGPFSLGPGVMTHRYVNFSPQGSGHFSAEVATGLPGGETVAVWGYGVPALPGETDRLELYFDAGWTSNLTWTSDNDETVTGYLVLHDATTAAGVAGWELCLELACLDYSSLAHITGWDVVGGTDRFASTSCLQVALEAPLPPQPDLLLATVEILVPRPHQNLVFLRPWNGGGLPDHAAYIDAADGTTRVPMDTLEPVYMAIINQGWVDVQAPTAPVAVEAAGQVDLQWPCDPAAEGYHVYRRVGVQPAVRLTAEPVACAADLVRFRDQPAWPAGTHVFYATTAVQGGHESTRSREVEVVLPGNLPRATRLLPCYPNPFNPETRIPFVLDRAAHVRLRVFDLAGRVVRVVLDESLAAGTYEPRWDGRDQAGRTAPSGTYYLRLETGHGVWQQKATLLK